MRNLFLLPRFEDRSSFLYLEHALIRKEKEAIIYQDESGPIPIAFAKLWYIMLGPGTKITHEAIKLLTEHNTPVLWVGEEGVRCYSYTTGTFSNKFIIQQVKMFANKRHEVALKMFRKRYPEIIEDTLQNMMLAEGKRMKQLYKDLSEKFKIPWNHRKYDQTNWNNADSINRAISVCNSCLYGLCHVAVVSVGLSPAIGFIHSSYINSFVLDIADFYKSNVTIPLAFKIIAESEEKIERRCRQKCRDEFLNSKLIDKIIPDMMEVLNVSNDLAKTSPEELERKAISIAT